MSSRSKREVAPAPSPPPLTFQAGSVPPPWWNEVAPAAIPSASNAMAPPAWWTGSLPQTTSYGFASPDCGNDLRPPGGFLSFFQNGQQPMSPPHVRVPAPWTPTCDKSIPTPSTKSGTKRAKKSKNKPPVINVDDGEDARSARRLVWNEDDDVRLVNAWLFHSNDPINGNAKKNESYWGDVVDLYNSTTPDDRKREIKTLKDRWQRIKRWVGFFCASWTKANSIYTSGQSDEQLKEKALQFYLDDFPKEGPFTVIHCWKILRNEQKWLAILEEQEQSNKRRLDEDSELRRITNTPEEAAEKERPMGTKEAKKQRNGKGKAKDDDAHFEEEMKKYMDIQASATKRQERFLETQQRISDSKVEAAKLTREAALLESYQKLWTMDTSGMSAEMKAEHTLGLKILREKLVGNTI